MSDIETPEKPADGPALFKRPADIVIGWKDRSDTTIYRAARAEADRLGVSVVFEAEPPQPFAPGPDDYVVSPEEAARMSADSAIYRQVKARAEAAGKKIVFAPRTA